MSEQHKAQHLKEWYENFLKLFREEFSKLSEDEKEQILRFHNYVSPCQIEVFWLKQPEWQLLVETHFEDRPDGEITINGPYDSSVFQDRVKDILNHPRWHVPVIDENPQTSDSPEYYSDLLAARLHRFVEMAKNALFSDWEKTRGYTFILTSKHYTITNFFGNMGDFDHHALIQHMINETKEQLDASKKIHSIPKKSTPEIVYPKGFATYFFPPIIIGENSKRTVNEIFDGVNSTHISTFDKKMFHVIFDNVLVLVEKDGFIGVCINDNLKSLEIMNTMMMVSVLDGLDAHIVREHELSEIEYDPKTHDIHSRSYHYGPPRNQLFDGIPDKISEYETKHVDEEYIKKIFEKASRIFEDKDLAEDLRTLLEATTHMKDSEFSQAFIMGWKIIEKHISQKWYKKQNTPNKKIKYPPIDVMINTLKDELQDKFSDFTELRKIRNSYMHGKKIITQKETQKCVDISKELVLKNSNFL